MLYFDIWKELRADVFKADVAKNYVSGLGECFANFTNLSLQTLDGENVRDPWSCNDSIPARQFNNNHDFSKELPFTSSIVGHIFQDSKDGGDDIAWVDALHPILLAIEPKEAASLPADSVEYTYTKFCNERCIYGSGFGPQIDDDDQIGQPLTYLLLFGFDEHHQIGRLLQRLHTLGCMRLAAIFDLRVIKNQFDYDLDDIEVATSNLEDELANLWNQTYEVYSDKETPFRTTLVWRRRENNKIADLLGKIHESLRKLGSVGAGVSPDPRQSYSVPMRAWRSTFYRERFDALIRALNSKFIEGYQPYGRFTEHRLIRAHHTIKFVAEHYRQLKEKEIRLRREWMALRSEHHQRDIADAQSLAELLFFVFLLPHYATDWPPIELFHNGINKLAGFSIDVHWVTLVVSVLLFAVFRYPQLRRSVGVIWKGPIVLWRAFGEIPQKWKDFDQNKPT